MKVILLRMEYKTAMAFPDGMLTLGTQASWWEEVEGVHGEAYGREAGDCGPWPWHITIQQSASLC